MCVRRSKSAGIARCALVVVLAIACRASAQPILANLGTLPGEPSSIPTGMSADGSVVVGNAFRYYEYTGQRPFIWTASSGLVDFGLRGQGTYNAAYGVSGNGQVVVGYGSSGPFGPYSAWRWTASQGYTDLPPLVPQLITRPLKANFDGSIIVGTAYIDYRGNSRIVRWVDGVVQSLGLPDGFDTISLAGMSADGQTIVCNASTSAPQSSRIFTWTAAQGFQAIGLPSGMNAYAGSISGDGSTIFGTLGTNMFRWTQSGGLVILGPFDGAQLLFCNNDGTVAIGTRNNQTILWTQATGIVLFADFLASQGVPLPDAMLVAPAGISGDGSIITGYANGWTDRHQGDIRRAWYFGPAACPQVTPPQISSVIDCPGTEQIFSVESPGTPAPNYQWLHDGVQIDVDANPSAATPNLILSSLARGDAGAYECRVTSACGSNLSFPTRLSLYYDFEQVCGGPGCTGDLNQDGAVDQGDVDTFICFIWSEDPYQCAPNIFDLANQDFNQDGVADWGDIDAFITVVAGGPCP